MTDEEREQFLDEFMAQMARYGASDTLLIVEDQEIEIRDAVVNYYSDIAKAYGNHIFFDTEYQRMLSDNIEPFLYINMRGLSGYTIDSTYDYGGIDLDYRAIWHSPRVHRRIEYVLKLIESTANHIYNQG